MTKPVCAVVGVGPMNGASFARRFAAEGYAVALLSRKTEYSSKLAAELGSAKAYACDVTDSSAIEAAFAAVAAELGEIDVLRRRRERLAPLDSARQSGHSSPMC